MGDGLFASANVPRYRYRAAVLWMGLLAAGLVMLVSRGARAQQSTFYPRPFDHRGRARRWDRRLATGHVAQDALLRADGARAFGQPAARG